MTYDFRQRMEDAKDKAALKRSQNASPAIGGHKVKTISKDESYYHALRYDKSVHDTSLSECAHAPFILVRFERGVGETETYLSPSELSMLSECPPPIPQDDDILPF